MAAPRQPKTPVHVAPAEPPLKVAPEPVAVAKECCATCKGGVRGADRELRCHGQPPAARYTNHVMGVGPSGVAIWPTVPDNEWCMHWAPKT